MLQRDLSDSQRAILEFMAPAYGEGLTLAHDIAIEIGVAPRSMGARLRALEAMGFIRRRVAKPAPSMWSDKLHGWELTDEGASTLWSAR